MSDRQPARVFDMPHARVTLTPVGSDVEIEVWPKAGQSAYVVVDASVAVLIAQQLVELAATQLASSRPGDGSGTVDDAGGSALHDGPAPVEVDNVVDLASRRPRTGRAS